MKICGIIKPFQVVYLGSTVSPNFPGKFIDISFLLKFYDTGFLISIYFITIYLVAWVNTKIHQPKFGFQPVQNC